MEQPVVIGTHLVGLSLSCIMFSRGTRMQILYMLALVLLVLWAIGAAFKVAGAMIHLLLLAALILVVFRLITGKRRKPTV